MVDIKKKLAAIVEQANCDRPMCKNCQSYKNGGCSFGCMNEQVRMTTPHYSCDNFKGTYEFDKNTVEVLNDLLEKMNKIDKSMKNLELLLDGKITEKDFVDSVE